MRLVCALSGLNNNYQLNGTIPSSLGNLIGLQFLCVCHAEWSLLHSAEVLRSHSSDLGANQLIGSVPFSLGSLTGLINL